MRLASIAEPDPRSGQAVVEVRYASLNHGDLNDATSGRLQPGVVLGSDAAGVVLRAAADGTGPEPGTRVVGLAEGAFQQRVAIATENLAVVPEGVDLGDAATLPVAGLAPPRTLRAAGPLRRWSADGEGVGPAERGREPAQHRVDLRRAVLPPYATVGPPKTLSSYLTIGPVGEDLAILVGLLSSSRLVVEADRASRERRRGSAARAAPPQTATSTRPPDAQARHDPRR
jgi:hypothetical protein